MNEYLDQTIEFEDGPDGQPVKLHRRIPINLDHNSDKYNCDYWTDEYTGDVYEFNLTTYTGTRIFKTTR